MLCRVPLDPVAAGVLGLEIADLDHRQLAVLQAQLPYPERLVATDHPFHPEADRGDAGAGHGRALGLGVADGDARKHRRSGVHAGVATYH